MIGNYIVLEPEIYLLQQFHETLIPFRNNSHTTFFYVNQLVYLPVSIHGNLHFISILAILKLQAELVSTFTLYNSSKDFSVLIYFYAMPSYRRVTFASSILIIITFWDLDSLQ
jgi:hypothetical protein